MPENGAGTVGDAFQRSPDSGEQLPDTALSGPPPPFSDQVLDNVLENVLCFLTSRQDRNAASLVCKSWFRAEAQTRSDLFIGNCYAVSPARTIKRFPRVHSQVLKGKPRFVDFNLVPWGVVFSPWASPMAPAYPRLKRICLTRMTVEDADLLLIARSLRSFRDLSLICCEGFTTSGLAAIAANCSRVRSLNLIDNDVEDDVDEVVDWMSRFPSGNTCLESLVFDCVRFAVNFEALEALVARSPSLRMLRVNEHISLESLCRLMMRAPQLVHLGTGSFASFQEEIDFEVVLESAFSACNSLVCLSGFLHLAPEYLPTIYTVCSNLTALNFSYAQISADQLKPVINRCHNLQIFWVLDSVGDEGLQMVAVTCKNHRELRVFPSDAMDSEASGSDVGLIAISEGCRKLQSISIFVRV